MSVIARETGKLVGGELGAAVYFRIGQLEHSRRTVFGEGFYLSLQSVLLPLSYQIHDVSPHAALTPSRVF